MSVKMTRGTAIMAASHHGTFPSII